MSSHLWNTIFHNTAVKYDTLAQQWNSGYSRLYTHTMSMVEVIWNFSKATGFEQVYCVRRYVQPSRRLSETLPLSALPHPSWQNLLQILGIVTSKLRRELVREKFYTEKVSMSPGSVFFNKQYELHLKDTFSWNPLLPFVISWCTSISSACSIIAAVTALVQKKQDFVYFCYLLQLGGEGGEEGHLFKQLVRSRLAARPPI